MSDHAANFHQYRSRLHGIAYRMLGARADVDDVLQDAYLRWHRADKERIQAPEAWLVTTVTRLCIDRLRSARAEREAYIGPWLPEPQLGQTARPADANAELASDLSVAFLVVLERLGPEERAAFLLHEVFDSGYDEIARILAKSESACRQIVHRARTHVNRDRPRFHVNDAARAHVLERFMSAVHEQDKSQMLALFAESAEWISDGGGKAKAARKPVRGAEHVARFVFGIWRRYLHQATHRIVSVNGESGLVLSIDGRPVTVLTIVTDGVRILTVHSIVNPDKLAGVTASQVGAC